GCHRFGLWRGGGRSAPRISVRSSPVRRGRGAWPPRRRRRDRGSSHAPSSNANQSATARLLRFQRIFHERGHHRAVSAGRIARRQGQSPWTRARRPGFAVALLGAAALISACGVRAPDPLTSPARTHLAHHWVARRSPSEKGIHKIRHVVIIMQENRSLDSYFGTFPGADGIPGLAGNPGHVPCVPDPGIRGSCLRPFHDRRDLNHGGPHATRNAIADINGGLMNGFVAQARRGLRACEATFDPACGQAMGRRPDVMGYHTGADIPNYWKYAHDFVLQDHMFQPDLSWSLLAHLSLVSEWSARCANGNPMSCRNAIDHPQNPPDYGKGRHRLSIPYAWTDLTYLLHKHHVP